MTYFSLSVEIRASPRPVWDVLSDIERWPEWTPTVTSVERMEHGPLGVGSRAWIRQPRLPPALWEVTELHDGRSFTWVTRSPGVRVTARHSVDASEVGSRATLSLRFSGPLGWLVSFLTRGLTERYLALEASGLKTRGESASASAVTDQEGEPAG
jgi:hypothetical protein